MLKQILFDQFFLEAYIADLANFTQVPISQISAITISDPNDIDSTIINTVISFPVTEQVTVSTNGTAAFDPQVVMSLSYLVEPWCGMNKREIYLRFSLHEPLSWLRGCKG